MDPFSWCCMESNTLLKFMRPREFYCVLCITEQFFFICCKTCILWSTIEEFSIQFVLLADIHRGSNNKAQLTVDHSTRNS